MDREVAGGGSGVAERAAAGGRGARGRGGGGEVRSKKADDAGGAEILETEAVRLEKEWSPKEGLSGLKRLMAGRDWDRAERELNRLALSAGTDEKKRLEIGRRVVAHGRLADRVVLEWFQKQTGEPVQVENAAGERVAGRVQLVKTDEGRILLATSTEQLSLRLRDLSTRDLVERACGPNPSNEAVLAAIDVGYFAGPREVAWRAAARARRRGLKLLPAQRELLDDSVTKAEWAEFEAMMKHLDGSHEDPVAGARFAREYLRKYRDMPTDGKDLQYGREMLQAGGGTASAEDLRLYTQAEVRSDGVRTHMLFPVGDELLDDFDAEGQVGFREETEFTLEASSPTTLLLPGLEYPEAAPSIAAVSGSAWRW